MINKIFLVGTIGDFVNESATQAGKRMINFSIKQEDSYWDKKTQSHVKTQQFIKCVMFSEEAEINRGELVMIEGKLGNKKNKLDQFELTVVVQKVTPLKLGSVENNGNHKNNQEDLPF